MTVDTMAEHEVQTTFCEMKTVETNYGSEEGTVARKWARIILEVVLVSR